MTQFDAGNILPTWGRLPEIGRLQAFTYKRGSKEHWFGIYALILLMYRSSMVRISDLRNKPRAYLSFEEELDIHDIEFNELTGEEIPLILFKLKNSALPARRSRYRNILSTFKQISGGSEFDILLKPTRIKIRKREELARFPLTSLRIQPSYGSVSPDQPNLFGIAKKEDEISTNELSIHVIKEALSIPLEMAAAGLIESLLLLLALIGQQDKIILLDEPALNLHPNLQLRFAEIFEKSVTTDRNQIIMVTHSPYLVSPQRLLHIWRMSQKNGESISKNLGTILEVVSKADQEKMKLLMTKTAVKGILFSRGVILTEGPSDRIILEMLDKEISERDHKPTIDDSEWALIDADGKMSMRKFIKLFHELGVPYAAIADPDAVMDCTETITTDGAEIKTSRLFADLSSLELLSQPDLQRLQAIKPSGKNGQYSQEDFGEVRALASKHSYFVLSATPEEILGVYVKRKESKPLVDSRKMEEMLSTGSIPQELLDLLTYIREKIKAAA